MTTEAAAVEEPRRGTLRRELRFWEAIALSIGIMAPTAAMALNGVAPAGLVGRAVPLAFLFAAIAIAFVSYAFIRLTRHFNHAGSAYALTGVTLGPHAGFFTGWAQMGTYAFFTAASIAEVGLFGTAFFDGTGIWHGPSWIVISLIAAALIAAVAYSDVKFATRSLLLIEALSVTLITILIVWIYAKVIGGRRPTGKTSRSRRSRRLRASASARSPTPRCSASSPGRVSRVPRRSVRRRTTRAATSRLRSPARSRSRASST